MHHILYEISQKANILHFYFPNSGRKNLKDAISSSNEEILR